MKKDEDSLIVELISIIISVPAVCILTIICMVSAAFAASGGKVKDLNFNEFRDYINTEGIEGFEAAFDGIESAAPVTGNRYIFIQIVTYCGADDIMSSFRKWNSDDDFVLIYKNVRVTLSPVKVRTFIEKTGSFQSSGDGDGRLLPSVEYGLVKGKKYFIRISSEGYHLPPDREDGKPRRRINHVLWISSRPYKDGKPQIELTPMYKGWSY